MKMARTLSTTLLLAAAVAVLPGCKKAASGTEITLPEGQVHLGAQWSGNQLWVESFDPRTATCTLSQYEGGKPVEGSTVTFKNCRAGMGGGPMARPMMPNRPGMQPNGQNRPGMMGRPGMPPKPGGPQGGQPGQPQGGQPGQPQGGAPATPPPATPPAAQ